MDRYTIRIEYEKQGIARFISHRDVIRIFSRALRRTDIPVCYSQGFNPHILLSFGVPLPLGFTSSCELFDLKVRIPLEPQEVVQRLNAVLPDGIRIKNVRYLRTNVRSLEESTEFVCYEVVFPDDIMITEDDIGGFLQRDSIFIKDKHGVARDVKPAVLDLTLEKRDGKKSVVSVVIKGKSGGHVRPELLVRELLGLGKREEQRLRIHRKAVSIG